MIPIRINEFMVLYDYERNTRHLFIAKNFSQHSRASVERVTGCYRNASRGPAEASLLPLIFLLPWQSFASREKRQNYGNEEIESNRFNKQKKKERKKTLNVQHTFRSRFRCRNRNDWGCQTWSEQQCDRRIA